MEQDAGEWWDAMCVTTRKLFSLTQLTPGDIAGISFCSQMQGLVLVDREGNALRRPMSYMDQRSKKELRQGMAHGVQIAGATW